MVIFLGFDADEAGFDDLMVISMGFQWEFHGVLYCDFSWRHSGIHTKTTTQNQ